MSMISKNHALATKEKMAALSQLMETIQKFGPRPPWGPPPAGGRSPPPPPSGGAPQAGGGPKGAPQGGPEGPRGRCRNLP